jgi:hypothetical protein
VPNHALNLDNVAADRWSHRSSLGTILDEAEEETEDEEEEEEEEEEVWLQRDPETATREAGGGPWLGVRRSSPCPAEEPGTIVHAVGNISSIGIY